MVRIAERYGWREWSEVRWCSRKKNVRLLIHYLWCLQAHLFCDAVELLRSLWAKNEWRKSSFIHSERDWEVIVALAPARLLVWGWVSVFLATVSWLVLWEERTGGLLLCPVPRRWDGRRACGSLRAGICVECWCQTPAFQKWETDCCNCAGKVVCFLANHTLKKKQHMAFLLKVYQLLYVAQNHENQSKF